MEIYTHNLLGITLQGSRLQSNFSLIDTALKNINEQLENLKTGHDSIVKTVEKSNTQIETLFKKLSSHQNQINKHSKWIQKMNAEFLIDSADSNIQQKQLKSFLDSDRYKQINISKAEGEKFGNLDFQLDKEKNSDGKLEVENANKRQAGNVPKASGKSSLQRTLAALKERLAYLEKETEANRLPIEEMNKILAKQKFNEEQLLQKRGSKQLSNKRRSLLKHTLAEQSKLEEFSEGDLKKGFQNSMESNLNQFFDVFAGKNSLQGLQNNKSGIANKEMNKQVQSLKENIIDKIRSIQAQYRQNQNRIGTIQKTIDVMQRSYEMLKYDFDRTTSSGWSRQRTNDTQDKGKRDKLGETRITNREYYEDKMAEIFQEMDKLRKECIDLQTKIQCEQVSQIAQICSKNSQDSTSKLPNYRLVSTIKHDGGQNKRQIATLKKELGKLRVQFEQFTWGVNTNNGETKTVVIKPNQTKQDWKALSTKIYKLKMQLHAGVRDLQSKIVTNNDMVVVLNQLEVGIEECKLLLKRKVQQSDYEKGLKRVEGRLNNFIMQVYQKEGKEQETQAALAKQPWFCLSCDSQLKNYAGKLLKSPTAQKLQGKKVNPQSHMVRRYDNSRLPSVLK